MVFQFLAKLLPFNNTRLPCNGPLCTNCISLATATIIGHVINIRHIGRVAIGRFFAIIVRFMRISHNIIGLLRVTLRPLLTTRIK